MALTLGYKHDGAGNSYGWQNKRSSCHYICRLSIGTVHSLCLSLFKVKSLEVQSLRNMIGVVHHVLVFYQAHPKRQRKLEEIISNKASVHKLKDLCHTRRVERIDALQRHCSHQLFLALRHFHLNGPPCGGLTLSQMPPHYYRPSPALSL